MAQQKQIRIHGNIGLLSNAVLRENSVDYQENAIMVINDIPCVVTQVGGVLTWCPLIRGYDSKGHIHNQTAVDRVWTVEHNLGTKDIWLVAINGVTDAVLTAEISYPETNAENVVILTLPTPAKGTAYLVGTHSFTAEKFVGGEIHLGADFSIDGTTLYYGEDSIALDDLATIKQQLVEIEQALVSELTVSRSEVVELKQIDPPVSKRHCAIRGVVDAVGKANFITSALNSLNVGLNATPTPLLLAFADGYNARGQVDYLEEVTADQQALWGDLPAKQLSFLGLRRVSKGVFETVTTLAPPQAAYSFPMGYQVCLRFDGVNGSNSILDDFGNVWEAHGNAKLQNNWAKTGGMALGGGGFNNSLVSGDYISCSGLKPLGNDGWTLRGTCRSISMPANGTILTLAHLTSNNGSQFGAMLGLIVNGGQYRAYVALSSNGTSWDVANAKKSDVGFGLGSTIHLELNYDRVAGCYYLYADGQLVLNFVTQERLSGVAEMTVGANVNGSNPMLGYIDSVELLPYCLHPAGDSFTPPTAETDITTAGYASEWFNISTYQMMAISAPSTEPGVPPLCSVSGTLFLGEVYTDGVGVIAAVSYAYRGKYDSGANIKVNSPSVYNLAHNIGTRLVNVTSAYAEFENNVGGWVPGDRITLASNGNKTYSMPFAPVLRRTQAVIATGGANGYMPKATGGNFVTYTAGDLSYGFTLERDF